MGFEAGNALIRLAKHSDISRMAALERDAATTAHWSSAHYQNIFRASGTRRIALVAEDDAGVCGFLVASQVDLEWELENIVVASSARRRGTGTTLLTYFIDFVRKKGAEVIWLEVRESNFPARALYQKSSFVERARRKGYYQDPNEDAVVYRLDFT